MGKIQCHHPGSTHRRLLNVFFLSIAVLLLSCMPRASIGKQPGSKESNLAFSPASKKVPTIRAQSDSSPPQKPLVLRATRLLDVKAGTYIEPATVVIEGDRIRAINPGRIPEDAWEINLEGLTLIPGLIDTHTHLTLDLSDDDWLYRESRVHVGHHAIRGVRNAQRTLLAGFTTVRDVGSMYFTDVALMRAIEDGLIPGPRIIPAGHAIGITGGHCDFSGYAPGVFEIDWRYGVADGKDELIKSVRHQIKHGARVIKICVTAGFISFEQTTGAQQLSSEELSAIVEEAHRHELKVAAHATGETGAIAAAEAGVDSIEHADCITERSAASIKRRGIFLVPTGMAVQAPPPEGLPNRKKRLWIAAQESAIESLRLAIRSGLKIAFGTDAGVYRHGKNAGEFAILVRNGMSPIEALRSATVYAAELLGVTDRGEVRSGLFADIVGVTGDPLENVQVLEEVDFVMKGGVVYKRKGKSVCEHLPEK